MVQSYTIVPLSPLRKVISARMTEAKRTIPHFRVVMHIEMDALLAARARINSHSTRPKVTLNDCIIKACAATLIAHPAINAQLVGDEIHQYPQADISVVVATEAGLYTPVIREADRKSVWDIASEVKELAARAVQGKLKLAELTGGSFSISNLGAYGVDQFDAIINPPQCAILAVGCARPRIIPSTAGEPRLATILRATLSVDHRAVDGVAGATFLAALRDTLERPDDLFTEVKA